MRFAHVTERLAGLGGSKWAVHIEAKRRAAAGEDLIFLSIGEPDSPPPEALVDRAIERLRAGRTRYSGGQGEATLLDALARRYSATTGRMIGRNQIIGLPGTQAGLFATMMALVQSGDEVLVADPYYATYEGVIAAAGACVVPILTRPEDGFHLTAEALETHISPHSRVLLLNSPGNPTGAVLSRDEIRAIGEVAKHHDLWIVSDEVYADLSFGKRAPSPFDEADLAERTIVVSSLSKSHAVPGLRTGWAVGPAEFVARVLPLAEMMLFGCQPFLQDAAAFALDADCPEVDQMCQLYQRRAKVVVEALQGLPNIAVRMPEGGMFLMVDVRGTGLSGDVFAWALLDEEKVVVMPGESFGAGGAGHVRLGLTADEAVLREACQRMARLGARLGTRLA